MGKYRVQGRVTLAVDGEIKAENQEDADKIAEDLLMMFTPDMPLSVVDQPDYEMGSVTEIE